MDQALLAEYKQLEADYKALEAKRVAMRTQIVEMLKVEGVKKAETDYGVFTVGTREVWAYTEKVKTLEEKVKIAKQKEQQKGLAKSTVTEYLVYTPEKLEV